MYGIEKMMLKQLIKLRDEYGLKGVKAEFEAEGSSFKDLIRLRRLTSKVGVELHLKIGGVEAIRDIKESIEIGVDGLIAPMVESAFGAFKFISALDKIYKKEKIYSTLNVETRNGINEFDDILKIAKGKIDNITIGRSDFSKSYFDKDIYPDSEFITSKILEASKKAKSEGFDFTVGGSVTNKTAKMYKKVDGISENILKLETRKIILPTDVVLNKKNAIAEALKFEKLYILSKKELSDLFIESEIARLTDLERRI